MHRVSRDRCRREIQSENGRLDARASRRTQYELRGNEAAAATGNGVRRMGRARTMRVRARRRFDFGFGARLVLGKSEKKN